MDFVTSTDSTSTFTAFIFQFVSPFVVAIRIKIQMDKKVQNTYYIVM